MLLRPQTIVVSHLPPVTHGHGHGWNDQGHACDAQTVLG